MLQIIKKYRYNYEEHLDETIDIDEDTDDIYDSIPNFFSKPFQYFH